MNNKIGMEKNGICFWGLPAVVYTKGSISHAINETNEDVEVSVEQKAEDDALFIRLSAKNIGDEAIYVDSVSPLIINELSFPVPSADWHVFLDGRHKNDLPAVCCLGEEDSLSDALSALTETGEFEGAETADGAMTLKSDRLLQIYAQDACLTASFRSAENCFFRMELTLKEDRRFSGLRFMCNWNAMLKPGQTAKSEWLCLDTAKDSIGAINRFAESYAAKKKKAPVLYSTWYYYGMDITPETICENLEEIERQKLSFDVFQLDDGWEGSYGNWEPNLKFPRGMKEIADRIRSAGMTAGIWTCPFTVHLNAPMAKAHPEWFLKRKDGEYFYFKANNRQNYILDVTHPEVIQYVEDLYRKLTNEWGYTYHKLDFTRCAILYPDAAFYNPEKPPVRAYKEAMEAVRRGIGEDSYLLVCGGLYDPLIGIADGQRTGSDVLSMWKYDGNLRLPYTVRQNILRYYMNEWWHNDADSLMVRRNTLLRSENLLALGTLTDTEAQTFTANQYIGGGLVGITERLAEVDEDRLALLKHITPIVETKVEPLSLYGNGRFISDMVVYIKEKGYITLCHINWTDEPENFKIELTDRIAPKNSEYVVAEFFGGKVLKNVKKGAVLEFGPVPPHGVEIIKIAEQKLPMVVGGTGHFSMGGEVDSITENPDKTVTVKTYVSETFPVSYKVLTENGIVYTEV